MKAIVIQVDGKLEIKNLATLEDWQNTVGGYVEMLCCGDHASAIVNEDGIALDLQKNECATYVIASFLDQVDRVLLVKDAIRGVAIIIGDEDEYGTTTDLSEDMIANVECVAEIWDMQHKVCPKCNEPGCLDVCFSCAVCYGPIETASGICDECFSAFLRLFSVMDGDYTREQAISQIDKLRGEAWKDCNPDMSRKDQEIPF